MKHLKLYIVALSAIVMLPGCNMSNTAKGGMIGTGGGAAIGTAIGAIAGGGRGAAIGAIAGGVLGAGAGVIIGHKMDKAAAEVAAQVEDAKVETVTDANNLKAVKVTFDSGILFATGKAELSSDAKNSLAKFSQVLKNNADTDIAIFGHTDNTGNDGINIPLSVKRAEAVNDYLRSCGITSDQIKSVEGKGSAEPVASNDTKDGRKENRRVEVYMYASEEMINSANQGQ